MASYLNHRVHRIAKHVLTSANVLEKSTYYVLDAQGNTMAVYERVVDASNQSVTFEHTEKHIFGSSRLGVMNVKVPMLGSQNTTYSMINKKHIIGQRNYELSNHLGNVLSVVSDKPVPHSANGTTPDYYMADIMQSSDYSAFGVTLSGRNFVKASAKESRRGFNGMEETDEWCGDGNSYDFGARMLDPRLGRWLTIDPKNYMQPDQSPYKSFYNNPLTFVDPDGKIEIIIIKVYNANTGKTKQYVFFPESGKDKVAAGDWYNESGGAMVQNFYDYTKTYQYTIKKDGTTKWAYMGKELVEENGVRAKDWIWGHPYDRETVLNEGLADTWGEKYMSIPGGLHQYTEDGGADPTKYKSKNNVSSADIEDFLTTLGALKNGSLGNKIPDAIGDGCGIVEDAKEVKEHYEKEDVNATKEYSTGSDSVKVLEIQKTSKGKIDTIKSTQSREDADTYIGKYNKNKTVKTVIKI